MEASNRPPLDADSVERAQELLPADELKQLMQALHKKLKEHGALYVVFEDEGGTPISISFRGDPTEKIVDGEERHYAKLTVGYNTHFNPDGSLRDPFPVGVRQEFELHMFDPYWRTIISGQWLSQSDAFPVNLGDPESRQHIFKIS